MIMGDFNIPSHIDHDVPTMNSEEYTRKRGSQVKAVLEWPVTKYLADLGYQDVYRKVQHNL